MLCRNVRDGSSRKMFARAAVALLSAVAGAALFVAPAQAAPATPGEGRSVVAHEVNSSRAERQRVVDYWTPQRMRDAIPAEVRHGVQPTKGKPGGGSGSGSAVQETPKPQLGKVFFTLGGSNYVCSGTATTSGNGDVVTTAGHCLNEGPGAFATNFVFVPAYLDGAAPYGKWTAEKLFTTSQWSSAGDFDYDVGFATLSENASGQSLTDVVGSYPIAFNLARGLSYTSYGYPAAKPYNGQSLWSCTGTVVQDSRGSTDQGLACSMTGGSSGGGWITGGRLNSVNSFKYRGDNSTMWGPYFGSVVQSVYNSAAAA